MALSLFPLSIPSLLRFQYPLKSHLCNAIFSSGISSIKLLPSNLERQTVAPRSNKNESYESQFMDENGVVDDMDGYLNYLSLEYDSVWDTKPSWCQPWTIALTGVSAVAGSWAIFHSVVITGIILSLICAWWYIFLYTYPKAYSDMIAERRNKVTNGVEDTFGLRKRQ